MPILEIHGKPIHRGIEAHVSAWTTALVYVSRILSGAFRGFHCSGVFAQASANTRVRIASRRTYVDIGDAQWLYQAL